MKKEFTIPKLEISSFKMENIVLTSGAVPTNVERAQQTLADDHNVEVSLMSLITL